MRVFFDDWYGLLRVAVAAVVAYVALVIVLRLSGARTLSKMNAFDLVVTVALGSTLATIILSSDVALAEGVLAMLVLVLLQFAITTLSVRSRRMSRWVKSEPVLLAYQGRLLPANMRRARVVDVEIDAALREQGQLALAGVEAVVLETDGSFSVLPRAQDDDTGVLEGLRAQADGPA